MSKGRRIFKLWKGLPFGTKGHELLVFCFFLAVSFGFWLLQALNETFEREVQVAVELENVPSDVVIIDSLPSTVSVVLRDRGLTLARHSISSLFRPSRVEIDFAKFDKGQNDAEVYIYAYDMQRMIGRIFNASTKIQSFRPDTLRYAYNHGHSRTLPVKLAGTVKASQQNYIQSIRVEPDSVRVFAPAAILDTMRSVYTEAFLLEGLHEHGSYRLACASKSC